MRSVPRKLAVLLLVGAMAACGPQSQKPAGPVVTGEGFAGVKFGMTVAQAEAALGQKLKSIGEGEGNCSYVEPDGANKGILFMVIDGKIARLDVQETDKIVTDTGAKIGDAESHVLGLYKGRVTVEEHKYLGPEGHYLNVTGADGELNTVFETDGKVVVGYRAGRMPEVQWVEGCS
jgi:hypothetical protein